MVTTYAIEKAVEVDSNGVIEMFREQFRLHHTMDSTYYVSDSPQLALVIREYVKKAIDENNPHLWVAKAEEGLVGFITFSIETSSYFDSHLKRYGEVIEVYVRESHRRSGLGKMLMEKAESYFQEQGCEFGSLAACASNKNAALFYDDLGYTETIHTRIKRYR